MRLLRAMLVVLLSAAVLLVILSPTLLAGLLPNGAAFAVHLDEFPLLGTCVTIASNLIAALRGGQAPAFTIVTNALGDNVWGELSAMFMIAMLTIPLSMIAGFLLYRPLYKGLLTRGLLYASLNLVSVMGAWVLYRQAFFPLFIEGVLQSGIEKASTFSIVSFIAQLLSGAAIGTIAIWLAFTILATKVVIGKIIMPIIGTFLRTLLFVFLTALILLTQADIAIWKASLPLAAGALILSGLGDWLFGS